MSTQPEGIASGHSHDPKGQRPGEQPDLKTLPLVDVE
jgi:hypothetical protein